MSSSRRQASSRIVEDLLAGRIPEAGPAVEALRRSGLHASGALVVVSAAPIAQIEDESALMLAGAVLARAGGDADEPLYAIREQEVVVVRPMRDDAEGYVEALDAARRRLRQDAIRLAVGVSAQHVGVPKVPRAYQEAWLARERVEGDGGLVALATMTPFDYLLLRAGDSTAWHLVPVRIRKFIDDDLSQAGLLIDTLIAYLESNLNAKLAAERLYVHPNTAHYRLGKIADLTGCDLRSQADLLQLAVAVQLARRR
jgi:sugar diacid utilization regulator